MLSLFDRSLRRETKGFYRMSISISLQKLLHVQVRNFGKISYKRDRIGILRREWARDSNLQTWIFLHNFIVLCMVFEKIIVCTLPIKLGGSAS